MKIKCINVGDFKSLTLNWLYDVVNETEAFYFIENDRGEERKYAKKYFQVYQEPVPEPPKPKVLELEFNNETLILEFGGSDAEVELSFINVAGNCGTYGVNGINDCCSALEELGCYDEDNIQKVVDCIINKSNNTITVFSTNKDFPELWNVLDDHCDFKSDELVNENTGNPIKVWGFYRTE